jgi:hypothetical protein
MSSKVRKSRRKVIEIYFVLYLAALVLLLPGKKETAGTAASQALTALLQQSFSIVPEKSSLMCRLITDSSGGRVLECDTSNAIVITGNIQDLRLECTVEDQLLRKTVSLENQGAQQRFKLRYDSIKQMAFFSWQPPLALLAGNARSRSFIVQLTAYAKPRIGQDNPELKKMLDAAGAQLRSEARFSISILNDGAGSDQSAQPPRIVYMPAETTYSRITMIQQQMQPVPQGNNQRNLPNTDFTLQPLNSLIRAVALQSWNNKILLTGINSTADFQRMPSIRIERSSGDNTGSAEIAELRAGEIILKGNAPATGSMKILISAQRQGDQREVQAEFIVQPQPLAQPVFPRIMYPGIRYKFIPNLPAISNAEIKAVLRSQRGEVISSPQGAPFDYMPDYADTGVVFQFERQLQGRAIGQVYTVKVENFPAPEILDDIQTAPGIIRVRTRSYGMHNGRDNRVILEITEGNSQNAQKPRELYGNFQADRAGLVFIQMFEVKARDPDKSLSIQVKAVDQRGKSSALRQLRSD